MVSQEFSQDSHNHEHEHGEHCSHDHGDHETGFEGLTDALFEDVELIETTDEEGNVHYFEKVDVVDFEGKEYALLVYHGQNEEEDEVVESQNGNHKAADAQAEEEGYNEEFVIMRLERDEDGIVYEAIEDDEEFERVIAHIEEMMGTSFDEAEDDEE